MQEDKEGLFDSVDTVKMTLKTLAAMLHTLRPRQEKMRQAASDPSLMATDLAEWLVRHGVPFREAHHQVGHFVGWCQSHGRTLAEATLPEMRESIPTASEECLKLFRPEQSAAARDILGGTAPAQVRRQLDFWKKKLDLQ